MSTRPFTANSSDEPGDDALLVSAIVRSLEHLWGAIAESVPELPDVAIVVASGAEGQRVQRWGHWAAGRWVVHSGERRGEILVAAERLSHGPEAMLCTLLHEATHALAHVRSIKDTSRQGRYHNERYRALAGELGLHVERDKTFGWMRTTPEPAALERYLTPLEALDEACLGYRLSPSSLRARLPPANGADGEPEATPRTGGGRSLLLVCSCDPPRKIRASRGTFSLGPIRCGLCNEPFVSNDQSAPSPEDHGDGDTSDLELPNNALPIDVEAPVVLDLASFANLVNTGARECPTGRFGGDKVFIHHVWTHLKGHPGIGELSDFQTRLFDANRAGLLSLSRADLVQAMDVDEVQRAEVRFGIARFHFIRIHT